MTYANIHYNEETDTVEVKDYNNFSVPITTNSNEKDELKNNESSSKESTTKSK